MLSESSTFLRFWLTDRCRERLIAFLPKQDLANLRLVCHDFSVRAAPALFENLSISFKASTFTRPARSAALDRLGFHVKHLSFTFRHTSETLLPPLIHPMTGDEINFTYSPQAGPSSSQQAKYGEDDVTELLIHQYPPIFHASTNVNAFVHALESFANLTHLEVRCPGFEHQYQPRRSTVDFALASLRIAVERNRLNSLDTLTLSPIPATGLLCLSPLASSSGATPSSGKQWSGIRHLSISAHPGRRQSPTKLLSAYLTPFQPTLQTLNLTWLGTSKLPLSIPASAKFPGLTTLHVRNTTASASHLRSLARRLQTLSLTDVELEGGGSWEEAFAPLLHHHGSEERPPPPRRKKLPRATVEMAEIPIMFAPPPVPMKHTSAQSGVRPAVRQGLGSQSPRQEQVSRCPVQSAPSPCRQATAAAKSGEKRTKPTAPAGDAFKRRKAGLLGRVCGVVRKFGL